MLFHVWHFKLVYIYGHLAIEKDNMIVPFCFMLYIIIVCKLMLTLAKALYNKLTPLQIGWFLCNLTD